MHNTTFGSEIVSVVIGRNNLMASGRIGIFKKGINLQRIQWPLLTSKKEKNWYGFLYSMCISCSFSLRWFASFFLFYLHKAQSAWKDKPAGFVCAYTGFCCNISGRFNVFSNICNLPSFPFQRNNLFPNIAVHSPLRPDLFPSFPLLLKPNHIYI